MTRFTPDLFAGSAAELTAIRRDIHRHPETAFEEQRTAQIVADKLQSWGIEVHRGLATTGVVGTLKGKRPGQKTIGLRADMDALHLQEKNEFDYASVHANKMHACGHDGHTTMLLGAAKHLAAAPDFAGTVHFIFQPAEEGLGGARVMIEEGLFDKFNCDAVYGMHNMPGFPSGHFAIRAGAMLASSDSWQVTFKGTGGHGAMPDRGTDPTYVAGQFIVAVQGIVGRNVPPSQTAVLSVGHIAAGSAGSPNVIPSEVLISGTARSFSADVRDLLGAAPGRSRRGHRPGRRLHGGEQVSPALSRAGQQRRADVTGGRGRGDDGGPRECRSQHAAHLGRGGFRLHAGEEARRLHHDRQWRAGRRRLPQRPFAALRLQRPHPDDGRGLLGQPGAARAGQRFMIRTAGVSPAS